MGLGLGENADRVINNHGIGRDLFSSEDLSSTRLEDEEKDGLIPSWITFRHELNEVEQENIVRGVVWGCRQIRKTSLEILDEQFVRRLHKRLLGNVWKWAGTFRTTEKNIGVAPYQIAIDLRNVLEDVKVWQQCGTYSQDDAIARFHHRLVAIYPFPNGNGRHARLMADLMARRLGVAPYSWSGKDLTSTRAPITLCCSVALGRPPRDERPDGVHAVVGASLLTIILPQYVR